MCTRGLISGVILAEVVFDLSNRAESSNKAKKLSGLELGTVPLGSVYIIIHIDTVRYSNKGVVCCHTQCSHFVFHSSLIAKKTKRNGYTVLYGS